MALHCETLGSGPAAVFVHGSFGWGLDTFPAQRELADIAEIVLVDRHGFGSTPDQGHAVLGWPLDAPAVVDVIQARSGAHLVGQSYGAVVSLLAASRRPDLIRSLVVIEPPLFGVASRHPAVARIDTALQPVVARALSLSARDYLYAWAAGVMSRTPAQVDAWTASWGPADWAAADASRRERWPGDAPVDLAALRALDVPKVVVSGGWPQPGAAGPSPAGEAFRAVADALAERIGAQRVEFAGSSHNPQLEEAEAFNRLLRSTWAASVAA